MHRRGFLGLISGFFASFFFPKKVEEKIPTPIVKEELAQYKRIAIPLCRRIYPGLYETSSDIQG